MKFRDWFEIYRNAGFGRKVAADFAVEQAMPDLNDEDPVEVLCAWAFANLSVEDLIRLSELLAEAADEDGAQQGTPLAAALERHGEKFRKPQPGSKEQNVFAGDSAATMSNESFYKLFPDARRLGEVSSHRPPANLIGVGGYERYADDSGYSRRSRTAS